MNVTATRIVQGLRWITRSVVGLGVAACIGATGAVAAGNPVTFDFDTSADILDPSFSQDGVSVWFRNDPSVDAEGRVQWLGPGAGPPPTPWSGSGHLRLSRTAAGGGAVTADVYFLPSLASFSLRAFQLDCYEGGRLPIPARCDNPLLVEVYGAADERLATLRVDDLVTVHPGGPAPGAGDYTLLSHTANGPITRLRIRGDANRSAFDQLVATPYDYGCGLGFELALLVPALAAWRRRLDQGPSSRRRTSA